MVSSKEIGNYGRRERFRKRNDEFFRLCKFEMPMIKVQQAIGDKGLELRREKKAGLMNHLQRNDI